MISIFSGDSRLGLSEGPSVFLHGTIMIFLDVMCSMQLKYSIVVQGRYVPANKGKPIDIKLRMFVNISIATDSESNRDFVYFAIFLLQNKEYPIQINKMNNLTISSSLNK